MPSPKKPKVLIASSLAGLLVLMLLTVFALTRPQRDIPRSEADPAESRPAGFNFYEIHRDTVLNRSLRQALADQLGDDAITHRAPVDLTIIDPAFTQAHFPDLHHYYKVLNPAFGGRREHAVTTLTYRRAQQKEAPFNYIKLVFAQDTGKPLYFVIVPSDADPGLFDTLQTKYGPPATIKAHREGDKVLVWKQPDEILAGVSIRRRGGRIERELHFYFMANIKYLIDQEHQAAEAQRRQTDKASRRAF
ncbi:MAG: hypothetical protein JJV98_02055 [Desulfosarcina sp.]|nr:hypothetical protein [Desulfobacterales bacterium]